MSLFEMWEEMRKTLSMSEEGLVMVRTGFLAGASAMHHRISIEKASENDIRAEMRDLVADTEADMKIWWKDDDDGPV